MKSPQPFLAGKTLPLLVEAGSEVADSPEALADWAGVNRARLDGWLHAAGAVLLRGFGLSGAEDFRAVCCAIRPELAAYVGGDSPRVSVADQVYTSTEFPPELEIALHNELSYGGWWPKRIFFTCQTAAETGGETHIADGRAIYANLDPAVREKFEERGVTYIQHLRDESGPPGPGKSWRSTRKTAPRSRSAASGLSTPLNFQMTVPFPPCLNDSISSLREGSSLSRTFFISRYASRPSIHGRTRTSPRTPWGLTASPTATCPCIERPPGTTA